MRQFLYMNETILNPRQQLIVNLVSQGNGVSSKYLEEQLENKYPASKATIARDLAILTKNKEKRGRKTGKRGGNINKLSTELSTSYPQERINKINDLPTYPQFCYNTY